MALQKIVRRNFALSEQHSRLLHALSQLDGLDPVLHVKKAVSEYLAKQKFDFTPPAQTDIVAKITTKKDDEVISRAVWISGNIDKYEFSALILNAPSKLSIDKGRILKLSISDPVIMQSSNNFIQSCILNYDRGWDIRPSKIAQPYYDKLMLVINKFLETRANTVAN